MKRLLSIILAVLMISGLTVTAFADAGGPVFKEYTATVSNPDGAKDKDEDKSIPYKEEVTVSGEYKDYDTGDLYSYVIYNGDGYYINNNDLSKTKLKVGIDEAVKLPIAIERAVFAEDGIIMYEGPSVSYEVVTKIPYGTELKSQYASSGYDIGWLYVSYNNKSGWVYIYPENREIVGINSNSKSNYFEIIDEGYFVCDENGKKAEIPVGTKLKYKYYDTLSGGAYVEYDGVKGWIENNYWSNDWTHVFDIVNGVDYGAYTNTSSLVLYEKPYADVNSTKPAVTATVPAGEFIYISKSTVSNSDDGMVYWYFTEYNGKSGWFSIEYNDENDKQPVYIFKSERFGTVKKDVTVYSEPSDNSDKLGTIKSGSDINILPNNYYDNVGYYYLVEYNGQYGWIPILEEGYDFPYIAYDNEFNFSLFMPDESQTEPSADETNQKTSPAPELFEKKEAEKVNDGEKESFFTPEKILAFCVAGACLAAAVAAMIIIIIRKKKKQ